MQALDSRNMGSVNCYMQKITEKGDLRVAAGKTAEGFLPIKDGAHTDGQGEISTFSCNDIGGRECKTAYCTFAI